MLTDHQGRYHFDTVIPGRYALCWPFTRPRHIHLIVTYPSCAPLTTQIFSEIVEELTTGLRSLWIQLIAFGIRGLGICIAKVELRVVPLRLKDFGPLHELPGLSAMR